MNKSSQSSKMNKKNERFLKYISFLEEIKDDIIESFTKKFPKMKKEKIQECWEKDINSWVLDYEEGENFLREIQGETDQLFKKEQFLFDQDLESYSRFRKGSYKSKNHDFTLVSHAKYFNISENDFNLLSKDEIIDKIIQGHGKKKYYSGKEFCKYEAEFIRFK